VNIAPSLYGWYRDHLSWHWMFWNSAVITPVMMLYLLPDTGGSSKEEIPPAPSFAGFLYASAGFAMLYAAIDQGERLDWWRSVVFTALFVGGSFFLLCSLVRRLRSPNPLVDMPYLRQWNTVLLGILLFFFRFFLVTTIILVPQSLAIHGFEPDQIGPPVIWSAAPLLLLAFVAGLLLLSKCDSRLLMASGFTCMALASCLNAEITSAWSASNYFRTELLMGLGQSFAFIGLVATIVLQGIFSGGLSKPQWILTFSAFFHTIRLFGGNLGAVFMGHFIAQREKLHSNLLGVHVQSGNWISDSSIRQVTAGLFSKSFGVAAATGRAVGVISGRLRLQAYTLSFIDGFYLVAGPASSLCCSLPCCASHAELRRPQRRSATIAYTSGGKIVMARIKHSFAFVCSARMPESEPGGWFMKKRNYVLGRWTTVVACALTMVCAAAGQERKLTLQEAIDLAKRQNHGLKASCYAVAAEQQKKRIAESNYFPSISNESSTIASDCTARSCSSA
jgi:MFS transporter, DHA2 family, multidrug resistance protein